jgi:predicted DNA-binding protein
MMVSAQIPDRDVERLDTLARERGQSRSAFLKEAVNRLMADLAEPAETCQVRVRSRKPASDGGA